MDETPLKLTVQKPAHIMLKPLKSNGSVSERNHAGTRKQRKTLLLSAYYKLVIRAIFGVPVNGVKMRGPSMLAKELIPEIHP